MFVLSYTQAVAGSNPVAPTIESAGHRRFGQREHAVTVTGGYGAFVQVGYRE